ncbi:hypothetical protein M404DRAFT_19820 [Pisolithus tinctorius Marx 270]|uniref:Uncharacterized protein n=1 Tax=Pisolithus tinctorius Marx 270 TaxID=870435 RepID=A0A0C3PSA2_PISTI|nr:hypothetical protein M404DRAFT_19820 [Pisolithus tinctorius Marx 270]
MIPEEAPEHSSETGSLPRSPSQTPSNNAVLPEAPALNEATQPGTTPRKCRHLDSCADYNDYPYAPPDDADAHIAVSVETTDKIDHVIEIDGDKSGGGSISRSALHRVFRGVVVATRAPDDVAAPIFRWILSCGGKAESDQDSDDAAGALAPNEWCNTAAMDLAHEDSRQLARVAIGVAFLREKSRRSQHTTAADLEWVWGLVHGAITHPMTTGPRFSASRSSQGFLAVPLCSLLEKEKIDELYRFHVWLPDGQRGNPDFAVHSHQSYAQSWILAGEGWDYQYTYEEVTNRAGATHAVYNLKWSDGKNTSTNYKTHQTSSTVVNTKKLARITGIRGPSVHTRDMSYFVHSLVLHRTKVAPYTLHATLFVFDSQRGFAEVAPVLGPMDLASSTQLRDPAGVTPAALANLVDAVRTWETRMEQRQQHSGCAEREGALQAFNRALTLCEFVPDFPNHVSIEQLTERVTSVRSLKAGLDPRSSDPKERRLFDTFTTWETVGFRRLSLRYTARGEGEQAMDAALKGVELARKSEDPTVIAMSRLFYGRALLREALKQFNSPSGCTPAIALCKGPPSEEHRSYLMELVDVGADMDTIDEQGYKALDYAVFNGDSAMEALVLEGLRRQMDGVMKKEVARRQDETKLWKGYRELLQELRPLLLSSNNNQNALQDVRRVYADALAVDAEKAGQFDVLKSVCFTDFLHFGKIPRSSDKLSGTGDSLVRPYRPKVQYDDEPADTADVVIFFSYCWINKGPGTARDTPDDSDNTQYKRMVNAIESFLRLHPSVNKERVRIWVDYACVDQDNPAPGVAALPMIIAQCDALISLVDDAYYTRAWCSVEAMMVQTLRRSYSHHMWYEHVLSDSGGGILREGPMNLEIVMTDKELTYEEDRPKGRRVARETALSKWSEPIGGQAFGRAWRLLDRETGQHERALTVSIVEEASVSSLLLKRSGETAEHRSNPQCRLLEEAIPKESLCISTVLYGCNDLSVTHWLLRIGSVHSTGALLIDQHESAAPRPYHSTTSILPQLYAYCFPENFKNLVFTLFMALGCCSGLWPTLWRPRSRARSNHAMVERASTSTVETQPSNTDLDIPAPIETDRPCSTDSDVAAPAPPQGGRTSSFMIVRVSAEIVCPDCLPNSTSTPTPVLTDDQTTSSRSLTVHAGEILTGECGAELPSSELADGREDRAEAHQPDTPPGNEDIRSRSQSVYSITNNPISEDTEGSLPSRIAPPEGDVDIPVPASTGEESSTSLPFRPLIRLDPAKAKKHVDRIRRFRILVMGRANAGKTTILQRVCNTTDQPEIFNGEGQKVEPTIVQGSIKRGYHDIEDELVFRSNPRFVFHDSCGFEAGSEEQFAMMKKFVMDHARTPKLNKRIHAIWFCIPLTDIHRMVTAAETKFFEECDTGHVPVVVLVTKADALELEAIEQLEDQGLTVDATSVAALEKKILDNNIAKLKDWLNKYKFAPQDYLSLGGK